MRDPECVHYEKCLTHAARANGPLDCDQCQRWEKRPPDSERAGCEMESIFHLLEAVFSPEGHEASM